MLVDYFIIFSITYIFVFTIATLAISVTGNMISSIILTILIMFFIPFVSSYLDLKKDMVSNNYEIVCNSSNCMNELNKLSIDEDDRNIKIYDLNSKSDYTIPYGLIYSILKS